MNADNKKKSVRIICGNLRCEASAISAFPSSSVSARALVSPAMSMFNNIFSLGGQKMKLRLLAIAFALASGLSLFLVWATVTQAGEIGTNFPSPTTIKAQQITQNDYCPSTISFTASFTQYLPLMQRYELPCLRAPRLISPVNGSLLDTLIPVLTYMRGSAVVSYTTITIADNPDFERPVQRYSSYGGHIGPQQLMLFFNLEPATLYYWRVQDVCGEVQSPYSEVYSFTTGSGGVILPGPILISPISGTVGVGQQVTLTWQSMTDAIGYQVWVRRVGSGGSRLYFTSDTSQVVRNREPNTTYEWYVKAYNAYAYGEPSEAWRYTTGSFELSQDDWRNQPLTIFESDASDAPIRSDTGTQMTRKGNSATKVRKGP